MRLKGEKNVAHLDLLSVALFNADNNSLPDS